MIKEIALDPLAAREPREMKRLIKHSLGPFCGKYLSKFPSNGWWQEYEARFLATQPHLLAELRQCWLNASHDFQRTFDKADDWCTNVHREHSLRPFAVVGATTPNSFDYPSPDDDRFDEVLHGGNVGGSFDSTPQAFVDICSVLIARGPEVVINDPYLSKLSEQDHSRILRALLRATLASRTTNFLIITQTDENKSPAQTVLNEFDALITNSPRGCAVQVAIVKKSPPKLPSNFHQRFLITLHGGFTFDQGFTRHRQGYKNDALLIPQPKHEELTATFISHRNMWWDDEDTIIRERSWDMPKR